MSMNKYISGIINCLDTVPSLKKQLVRAFKKVEEDVTGKENAFKSIEISGTTTSNGNLKISSDNTICIMSVHLATNNVCAIPYTGEDGIYIHVLNVVSPVGVAGATAVTGIAYYNSI